MRLEPAAGSRELDRIALVAIGTATGLACASILQASEATVIGRASVIDGDTVDVHGVRVRFSGIDAPESWQLCIDRAASSIGAERYQPTPWTPSLPFPGLLHASWSTVIDMAASSGAAGEPTALTLPPGSCGKA